MINLGLLFRRRKLLPLLSSSVQSVRKSDGGGKLLRRGASSVLVILSRERKGGTLPPLGNPKAAAIFHLKGEERKERRDGGFWGISPQIQRPEDKTEDAETESGNIARK